MIGIGHATAALAGRQGEWIAVIDPWRSMGFTPGGLAGFLQRSARPAGGVLVARENRRGPVLGIVCVQAGVLLGDFVSLLAVRPESAGRGIGRALMDAVAERTFAKRRWLYVSVDESNRAARAFYRKLGFERVGRLPELVRPGRVELLLRKPSPTVAPPSRRPSRRRVRG
ncbi:MAG TPA: N-acetyltransferase [Polyangia bacterium]|jgi:ribosomal protein S18 acetylase RimI-like enzyme|nr:N-acetyltransferase [Polyangia bacterium]